MTQGRYRWNDAPGALTAAIWTLARRDDGFVAAQAAHRLGGEPLPRPLLVAVETAREPLARTTLQLAARATRPVVAIGAELRGRLPRFEFAVGLPGDLCNCYSAYEAWLPVDGPGLWLVSAFLPHPDIPLFRLGRLGLTRHASPPWSTEQDRDLGLRQATLAIARLIGEEA